MITTDHSKFTVNSDFPMPAQTIETSGSILIPTGTDVSQTTTLTSDVAVDDEPQIFILSIECSRDNLARPSFGQGVRYYLNDCEIAAFVRNFPGRLQLIARLGPGFTSTTTTSDIELTFHISGFKLP